MTWNQTDRCARTAGRWIAPLLVLLAACSDPARVADRIDDGQQQVPPPAPTSAGTFNGLLADRAWVIDDDDGELISTREELVAGLYRFRAETAVFDSLHRDDLIVVQGKNDVEPRRVLRVAHEGGVRIVDTGPALWSDAFQSGNYVISATFGASNTATSDITVAHQFSLPAIGSALNFDVCAGLAALPGPDAIDICGGEKEIEKEAGKVTVALNGEIDSLAISDGFVELTGSTTLELVIDAGGISGGTPPTFAPCNSSSYPGCLGTPSGAAWLDWLRRHAPAIPDGALRPARICIPGTPVRIRAGRWEGIRWQPPVYQQCRIANNGVLPTVIKPSLTRARSVIQPRLRGQATVHAAGKGSLTLTFELPQMAVEKKHDDPHLEAKVAVGIFAELRLQLGTASVTATSSFDEEIRVVQTWTPAVGWQMETTPIRSQQENHFDFGSPDTVAVTLYVPLAKVGLDAMIKVPIPTTPGLEIGAGLGFAPFEEGTWSRQTVHPSDPEIDTWHIANEHGYQLRPEAKLKLPELFSKVVQNLEWEPKVEFGRVRRTDYWGVAPIKVATRTNGVVPPGGYRAIVERSDTFPVLILPAATRDGSARDHGTTMDLAVNANDTVTFAPTGFACTVDYMDGIGGLSKSVIRKAGFSVPNWAGVGPHCNLIIASHKVHLTGVPANCVVEGGATRDDVWPLRRHYGVDARSDTTLVEFEVTCAESVPLGAVVVTVDVGGTAGKPIQLLLDGSPIGHVIGGEPRTIDGLSPGSHTFSVGEGLPDNCHVTPGEVMVVAGEATPLVVFGACFLPEPAANTIGVRVISSAAVPETGYWLSVDGDPHQVSVDAGFVFIPLPTPGHAATVLLGGIPDHCRVGGLNPRLVGGGNVTFAVECTSQSVTTLEGYVTSTEQPTLAVVLQPVSGAAVHLTGSLVAELAQLSGLPVRLHGTMTGISLEVFGYEIISTAAAPRWSGILAARNGVLWLFAAEAIELVDAPAALAAKTGALVWIGGQELSAIPVAVVPRVYGVIREEGQ